MKHNARFRQINDSVIQFIRGAFSTSERQCPFHLDLCGACKLPSFQQPCPHCGYYPYGGNKYSREKTRKLQETWDAKPDRDGIFKRNVTRYHGFAQWYVENGAARSVAARENPSWICRQRETARKVDEALLLIAPFAEQVEAILYHQKWEVYRRNLKREREQLQAS